MKTAVHTLIIPYFIIDKTIRFYWVIGDFGLTEKSGDLALLGGNIHPLVCVLKT